MFIKKNEYATTATELTKQNEANIEILDNTISNYDQEFENLQDALDTKQMRLTAGKNIMIDPNGVISATGDIAVDGTKIDITQNKTIKDINSDLSANETRIAKNESDIKVIDITLDTKQDKLIAGDNITIDGNTISATAAPIVDGSTLDITKNKSITDLQGEVDTKANQSDLTSLQGLVSANTTTIATKANQSDLTLLQNTVNGKADSFTTTEITFTMDDGTVYKLKGINE